MKNRNNELLKNTIIIFLGKASTQLLSFLLLPLYTAFLSTKDYGTVDLIITYIQLLVPVLTLEIEMAAFRFVLENRKNENDRNRIIYNVLLFITLICGIVVFAFILFGCFINIKYKLLILINILVSMYGNSLLQVARGLGENIKYSLACFLNGLTTIIMNIILIIIFKRGAMGMLISMFVANLIMSLYLFIALKIIKMLHSKKDKKVIKEMTKYSIPLVPNLISWWIISVSDRTIISIFLNVSVSGIYSVANKFSTIFIGIYNVFNLSWTESAALHFNDKDRDIFFSDTINNSFKIFSSICIMIIAMMPFVFNFIVKGNYGDAYYQVPILLLSTLCNVVIGLISAIYVAKKMSKKIAATSFWSAIINVIINILFINTIGIYAASLSTLAAYFIMMIYRLYDVKTIVKINHDYKFIISFIILLIPLLISYYLENQVLSLIILLVSFIYCFISNYRNILILLKKGKDVIHAKLLCSQK